MNQKKYNYGSAICSAFEYLLENYPEVFVIGQGLWSPWYVGNSMTDLDKKYGKNRIIDTPVSESASTGAAVGASLAGMRPVVVHPRMDFMIYAMDSIVNQAAKWSSMFGCQANPSVTIRSIINRGGEQGAQHSQALHAWFAHVPGLRVVMPSSVADARDLLIASVLCDDPVIYIDDRWLYDQEDDLPSVAEIPLKDQGPRCIIEGPDLTIVGSGFTTYLSKKAAAILSNDGVKVEVIDLRILNPFDATIIIESVKKTGYLLVVDSGTLTSGFSAEVVASICEAINPTALKKPPKRVALPDAPAPTSHVLEDEYYIKVSDVVEAAKSLLV
jgi:acetoin:2,6-dichlorophenolindophenol oxidoreductase subunit beta